MIIQIVKLFLSNKSIKFIELLKDPKLVNFIYFMEKLYFSFCVSTDRLKYIHWLWRDSRFCNHFFFLFFVTNKKRFLRKFQTQSKWRKILKKKVFSTAIQIIIHIENHWAERKTDVKEQKKEEIRSSKQRKK